MSIQNIIKSVESNNLTYSNYLFFGEETFFIDQIEHAFLQYIIPESEKTFNQKVFYGKDVNVFELISVLKSFPMLGSKQLIVLREANKMDKIHELENYFKNPVETTIFVLCYKSKTIDRRKKWIKLFQNFGLLFENKKIYGQKISQWINNKLGEKKITIKKDAEALLVDSLGADLPKIDNALCKLISIVSNGIITIENVQNHIGLHREYNTFELQNALAEKNNKQILLIVDYFITNSNKFPLPPIIGVLFAFFSKLLILHGLSNHSDKYVAEKIKVHPFFVHVYKSGCKHYSFEKCTEIISFLKECDLKSKGIDNTVEPPLRELIFNIIL